MKIDLQIPDSWAQLGEAYKQALPFADDPRVAVQVYLGIHHALWEIGQALAQTFPHRRTVLYDQNAGPEFEPVVVAFAKEGFTWRALELVDMRNPDRWFEATQKDALFLLSAFDDPATGEVFHYPALDTQFKDKRIFRVRVSHSYHQNFILPKPESYEIHLYSVSANRVVAVLGDRAKMIPTMAPFLQWPEANEAEVKQAFNCAGDELRGKRKSAIESFEKHFSAVELWPMGADCAGDQSGNRPSNDRLWDRSILTYTDVEGLSLIAELKSLLGFASSNSGASSEADQGSLQTLSLCQWQEARQMQWLQKRGLSLEALRGSLLISADLLIEKGPAVVAEAIKKAHAQLLVRQTV